MGTWRRLLVEIKPLIGSLVVLVFLSLVGTGLSLLAPWGYRELINYLTEHKLSYWFDYFIPTNDPMQILVWIVGIWFVVGFVENLWGQIEYYFETVFGGKSRIELSQKGLEKIQRFSLGFFEMVRPGKINERLGAGSREVFFLAQSVLAEFLPIVITLITAGVVISSFDLKLGLGLVIFMPLYALVSLWRTKVTTKMNKKSRKYAEEASGAMWDAISYQPLIRQFGREKDTISKFKKYQYQLFDWSLQENRLRIGFNVATGVLYDAIFVWVYVYGGWLILQGKLQIGDLVLFQLYLNRTIGPITRVLNIYDRVQNGLVTIKRMFSVLDMKEEVSDLSNAKIMKSGEGMIEFKNVSFVYPQYDLFESEEDEERFAEIRTGGKGKRTLASLNLVIKPGEKVALVGPSGAGKTTIIKMIMRYYDPQKGEILIDGQDIKTVTQESLRKQMSVVMQDSIAFNDTVSANLRYAKPSATDKELETVSKMAQFNSFVMGLEKKFKTMLGEKGVRLSGGERQRLSIARAFLRDSKIVILDEATSALDSENENKIQQAMWKLLEKKTAIIIAHRLSTVKKVDRVIVIQKGKIIEQGTHKELIKRGGYYKKLTKMQGVLTE